MSEFLICKKTQSHGGNYFAIPKSSIVSLQPNGEEHSLLRWVNRRLEANGDQPYVVDAEIEESFQSLSAKL